ncbi:MAG: phosphatidylserine decarboxylase [Trichlorobacter sp.]|jgi:phosphatidylserine decarboxylase
MLQHQYIERDSGRVLTEQLLGDRMVRLLYHRVREHNSHLFRMLTSSWMSQVLAAVQFDRPVLNRQAFLASCGIDLQECLDRPDQLGTARRLFERKIRYWECRPMPGDDGAVVSPADARAIPGCFSQTSLVCLKDKFFAFDELFGMAASHWRTAFQGGDFMVFRLTPDKYHYNHAPVAGKVVDFYSLDGCFHSCNPSAIVSEVTPYSKNRRVVTIIDSDVPGGTGVGLVAMIEVVALMIGDIVQAYSAHRYDEPQPVEAGMFLAKGQPKSLYRPGSSTDILIFEPGRISFAQDLVNNSIRSGVSSRFSHGFGRALVETDLKVRSLIATRR